VFNSLLFSFYFFDFDYLSILYSLASVFKNEVGKAPPSVPTSLLLLLLTTDHCCCQSKLTHTETIALKRERGKSTLLSHSLEVREERGDREREREREQERQKGRGSFVNATNRDESFSRLKNGTVLHKSESERERQRLRRGRRLMLN
jgi:hypothetical protein